MPALWNLLRANPCVWKHFRNTLHLVSSDAGLSAFVNFLYEYDFWLGRFVLRDMKQTVGVGIVKGVNKVDDNSDKK